MKTPELSKNIADQANQEGKNPPTLSEMREQILTLSLYAGWILAGLIFPTHYRILQQTGNMYLLFLYIPAIVVLFVAGIFRSIPYRMRAFGFIFAIYIIGLASLLLHGLGGTARAWLIVFPIMTAVLVGLKSGIVAVFVSLVSWGAIGSLMRFEIIPQPSPAAIETLTTSEAWVIGAAGILTLSSIAAISIGTLLRNLERTLEQEHMLSVRLEHERSNLEENVRIKTHDLSRRLLQIRTAAEISRAISGVLEQDELLYLVVNLVKDRFELYYAGVFLLDDQNEYAVLRAGTGEAGQKLVAQQHRLAVGGTSMIGWACENRRPRIALDVGQDAVQFNNPFLPYTRSELALPLISGEAVLGAMTVQSTLPAAFDENDITVLQGIADSLATALENARLFQQAKENLEEIEALHRQYLSEAWRPRAGEKLQTYEYQRKFAGQGSGEIQHIQTPIKLRDQVIGRITLDCDHDLAPEELDLIEKISSEAAVALENARLLEEIRQRSREEHMLNSLTAQFTRSLSYDRLLKTAVQELGQLPNVSQVSIRIEVPNR